MREKSSFPESQWGNPSTHCQNQLRFWPDYSNWLLLLFLFLYCISNYSWLDLLLGSQVRFGSPPPSGIRIRSVLFVSSSLLSRLTFDWISLGNFSEAIIPEVFSYFLLLFFSNQLLFSADILSIVSGISKILSNKSTPCPFETRLSFPTYVSCLSQCGWNKGVKRRPLC